MTVADIYIRLSIDLERATSLERQEADCRRWCAEHGLQVRHVHADRGLSGYSHHVRRDGFTAALAAVTSREVSTLVVWKLDRLSRRGIGQMGQLLDSFEQARGRLVSVKDGIDTAQPQSRMVIALMSEFARTESETIGLRVRSAKEAQRAQGLWLSGKPPFGYTIGPDRRLMQVEPAASLMREVFDLILAGHTLTSVCGILNGRGAVNSRGRRWQTSALSEALKSPAYAGLTPARHVNDRGQHAAGQPALYRDADTGEPVSCLTPGTDPIISRARQLDTFDVLQARLQRYGRGRAPRRPAYALLVRGLGRCGSCGRPLTTNNGYRCVTIGRFGDIECTRPAIAMVRAVDSRVTQHWLDLVSGDAGAAARNRLALLWMPAAQTTTVSALVASIRSWEASIADADAARFLDHTLDVQRHRAVTHELTRKIENARHELARHTPNSDGLNNRHHLSARWNGSTAEERRRLLRFAWDRIEIAKAAGPGGPFDDQRIRYHPTP